MRRNIIESIQDKINAYDEEVQNCNLQLNELQRQLQALLKEEDLSLEAVLLYKDEIVDASAVDTRLVEIDSEIDAIFFIKKVRAKRLLAFLGDGW